MKALVFILVFVVALGSAWSKYVTHDGLLKYYDQHPKAPSGARVLYTLGKGNEFFNNYDKMLGIYGRVIERYPRSPQAMEARFGHALALERLNRISEAIAEYEVFLEKHPKSKYAASVRNNIEILKSR